MSATDIVNAVAQSFAAIGTVGTLAYAVSTQRRLTESRGWPTVSQVKVSRMVGEGEVIVTVTNGSATEFIGGVFVLTSAAGGWPMGTLRPGLGETVTFTTADVGRLTVLLQDQNGQAWKWDAPDGGDYPRPTSSVNSRKYRRLIKPPFSQHARRGD